MDGPADSSVKGRIKSEVSVVTGYNTMYSCHSAALLVCRILLTSEGGGEFSENNHVYFFVSVSYWDSNYGLISFSFLFKFIRSLQPPVWV
jgi:hypothetical protein